MAGTSIESSKNRVIFIAKVFTPYLEYTKKTGGGEATPITGNFTLGTLNAL